MILKKLVFLWCLCSITGMHLVSAKTVELIAEFNSEHVNATAVSFTQTGNGRVEISREKIEMGKGDKLSIHEFPVKYNGVTSEMCSTENVGGMVHELSFKGSNYSVVNGSELQLTGPNSIFGHSLVFKDKNGNVACATIKSNVSSTKTLVGVFRAQSPGIAGTIVLRQAADGPSSVTAVDIDLMLVDARSELLTGLSLAVYKTASSGETEGSCEGVEELFNPLGKTSCDKRKHSTCPIGDLSAKLGQLDVPLPAKGNPRSFYIDTNLPLSGKNSVSGRSLVILSRGTPLICAKIQEFQEMAAEVTLKDDKGLIGRIGFIQGSPYEPVVVNVSLSAEPRGINVYEHASADVSCDVKELGKKEMSVIKDGANDGLTMYGAKGIMFRLLTVQKMAPSQDVYCKKIQPKDATYELKAQVKFNETTEGGVAGFVNFEQVMFDKSKAFAYMASIVMSVGYKNNKTKVTQDHNWHVHVSRIGDDSALPVGEKCKSALGHYNPYQVYVPDNDYASTCKASNPFRCEIGDLSKKLPTYSIGGGLKHFTENENYLASWHNIIGRSVVIHTEDQGDPRFACADVLPHSSFYKPETVNVKNTSKTRDKESFQKVVSGALSVASWRVADMKYEAMKNDKKCLTYKFLLIDDSTSNLHRDFQNLIEDNPGKLKEFAPACGDEEEEWKINDGKSSEILGVVFGLLFLIILIVAMIIWLRKRRKEHEEASKLVQSTDAEAIPNPTVLSAEKDDKLDAPSDSDKKCKVTTSL